MWPFNKEKKTPEQQRVGEAESVSETGELPVFRDEEQASPDAMSSAAPAAESSAEGEMGPFDADTMDIQEFDFSDFSENIINLGSMQIPLPNPSEIQVEMGDQGPRMLHILTEYGRITPVAFAAPRSGGQWRTATIEIADGMRAENVNVTIEDGPWGREVVGKAGEAVFRVIGVDGPRWMLRFTMASPFNLADQMADLAREIVVRTFVTRGSQPIPAGNPLPVALPTPLVEELQRAQAEAQAKQQVQEQPEPQPFQTQSGPEAATPDAPQQPGSAEQDQSYPAGGEDGSALQQMKPEFRNQD